MTTIDELFTGRLVTGVPEMADLMPNKSAGFQDPPRNGDHCGT